MLPIPSLPSTPASHLSSKLCFLGWVCHLLAMRHAPNHVSYVSFISSSVAMLTTAILKMAVRGKEGWMYFVKGQVLLQIRYSFILSSITEERRTIRRPISTCVVIPKQGKIFFSHPWCHLLQTYVLPGWFTLVTFHWKVHFHPICGYFKGVDTQDNPLRDWKKMWIPIF